MLLQTAQRAYVDQVISALEAAGNSGPVCDNAAP